MKQSTFKVPELKNEEIKDYLKNWRENNKEYIKEKKKEWEEKTRKTRRVQFLKVLIKSFVLYVILKGIVLLVSVLCNYCILVEETTSDNSLPNLPNSVNSRNM